MFSKTSPITNHQTPTTLLIGLGNPGDQYTNTRHNIGFMALDNIAAQHQFPAFKKKFSGLLSEGRITPPPAGGRLGGGRSPAAAVRESPHPNPPPNGEGKVILLKPLTYMNLSGESVAAAAQFYKIPPERIIVFHDELDLPLAKIRVKKGGGHGGHNGLKSIDAHIGKEYHRVRIGIAHPGDKEMVTNHVLSDFSKTEMKTVDAQLIEISHHIALLLAGDAAGFMNKLAPVTKE